MSIIKGPFDFTGSYGDMRCYDDPSIGKRILSRKGGPTRVQFLTDPAYARQRQVSNEFGGCSIWASQVKQGLSDVSHLMYSRCFGQIKKAGNDLFSRDVISLQGFRSLIVNSNPSALPAIDFNVRFPFNRVLKNIYEIGFSPDKKTVTMSIPGFISSRDAMWVSRYYAVRFYLVIAQIADVVWNPVKKTYERVVSDLEVCTRSTTGNWIVRNSVPIDVNITVSIDEPAFTSPGTSVIVGIGVEFSLNAINNQPSLSSHCGSMAIVRCFTS